MRKYSALIFISALISLLCFISFAHGGRTDSNGGHYDRSTGEYHYHHGYSAHDHYDMDGDGDIDCPYKFNDKTNHNSNSGNSNNNSSEDRLDNLFNGSTTATTAATTTAAVSDKSTDNILSPDIVLYIGMCLGLFGFIFCIFWLKNTTTKKEMFDAVLVMTFSVVMFALSLGVLINL